jgi:hypothetical protein
MRHCGTPNIHLVKAGGAYYVRLNSDSRSDSALNDPSASICGSIPI